MRAQLPTNSVPNWLATVTGLTPDMIGALGNRNLGTTAYDNIYRMMGRFSEHWADHEALASPYLSVMAASPWFTGLVKTDLPYLVGDGSTSYVANEDDALDRSEIFQRSTEEQDASRFHVAHKALSDDDEKDYHFLLLHLTDVDSQARHVTPHTTASRDPASPTPPLPHSHTSPHRHLDAQGSRWGKADAWNKYNMNASHSNPGDAPWTEFVPEDAQPGGPWRANSYKRAIARTSDHLRKLIEDHGDERTLFVIMGDHGHTEPGGAGGAADEVRIVPLFAYQKGSNLGQKAESARTAAGTAAADSPRFVAKARELSEAQITPTVVTPADGCDILDETVGDQFKNTCDEWRDDGTYAVDIIDIAPTVMALLGLPVPRHSLGVFIDDIVGGITTDQGGPAAASMLGKGCTGREVAWESPVYNGIRGLALDRMCNESYHQDPEAEDGKDFEVPGEAATSEAWSEDEFIRYRHVLHYRDLYQQKLSYVRGYLEAVDALRVWEEGERMTFLKTTVDGKQFYDEGSNGRCSAYDPLNMRQTGSDGSTSTNAYVYTILPCAYGTIAHCGQKFLTGEHDVQGELRDKDVCTFNDWNLIKIYYVQVSAILAQFWRNSAQFCAIL